MKFLHKSLHYKLSVFLLVLASGLILAQSIIKADEIEDIGKQISDLQQQLESSVKATKPLEAEVAKLNTQLKSIQGQISAAEKKNKELEASIEKREGDLKTQYVLLAHKVRAYYKSSRFYSPLLMFVSSKSAADLTRGLVYKMATTDQDKNLIVTITTDILRLEEDKKKVEADKVRLAALQVKLDKQVDFFEGEISGAKKWQAELNSKISELSAKQKALLEARSGSFTSSVGDVPIGKDFNASIAFKPSAPGGSLAVFSFGGYTHRKGMSQYGAKGRAEAGQDYKAILKAYYGKDSVNKDTGGSIEVSGIGNINFEEQYLMGIAEMPSDWHKEALKAQAVAARTYAYRYKVEGKAICTTQACQVYSSSKAANPPAEWRAAVEETKGVVLEDVVTYYSSTAGGYLTTSGWDTTDGQGGSGWAERAWENKASSPWFYKAWYRESYLDSSGSCGRSHPWLSREEFADILNAWLVRKSGDSGEVERILPTTINSCPVGGSSGNPYSMDELKAVANKYGGAFTSVTSAETRISNDGYTSEVVFQTNKGSVSVSGSEFKDAFNLRAPGYISIRSPLYQVEYK